MTTPNVTFPPRVQNPASAFTRFMLGDLPITVVSGGHIILSTKLLAPNADPADRAAFIAHYGLPTDAMRFHTNHFIIDDSDRRIMIDVGDGGRFRGATAGRLENGLLAAGIAEDSITDIVLTHGHADHLLALGDGGADYYPNAKFYLQRREHDYWHDDGIYNAADARAQGVFLRIRATLAGIALRTVLVEGSAPITEAARLIPTHGHTPGHQSLLVTSQGQQIFISGDVFNHHVANLLHPEWTLAADVDGAAAAATRVQWLNRMARDQILLGAYHFPFPGIGHIREVGGAFAFDPVFWEWPL